MIVFLGVPTETLTTIRRGCDRTCGFAVYYSDVIWLERLCPWMKYFLPKMALKTTNKAEKLCYVAKEPIIAVS